MRNADCSDSWVERSEWNAMMSGKLCCFRMRVRASNRLFSCLAESGVVVGVARQIVFKRISIERQSVMVGCMFENLTFIRQK